MTHDLSTYILAVADGEGLPSQKQWNTIVEMAGTHRRPTRPLQPGRWEHLAPARKAAGLSQAELGVRVGTSQQTIDRLERGITKHSRHLRPALAEVGIELEITAPEGRRT